MLSPRFAVPSLNKKSFELGTKAAPQKKKPNKGLSGTHISDNRNPLPPLSGTSEYDQNAEELYKNAIELLPTNKAKSMEMLKIASELNNVNAKYSYAHLLSSDPETADKAFQIMGEAAKEGQSDGIYEYGFMLENGIGCKKNINEALSFYKIGIDNHNGKSMYRYAKIIKDKYYEIDTDNNENDRLRYINDVFRLFREAYHLGVPNAYIEVGLCLKEGVGVEKDLTKAAQVFQQLANSNDPNGMLEYALCLKNGIGVKKNLNEYVKMIKKAVETKSPDALLTYGRILENGDGFEKNLEEAENIYKSLITTDSPNPYALNSLALLYQNKKQYEDALKYYNLAYSYNHPTALFSLAMLQLSLHRNEEGMQNLKKAADKGNPRAQFNYAIYLEKNNNANKEEIIHYYKMASDANLPNAMCNYASFIYQTDKQKAISLFKAAANKGHTISQYRYAKILTKMGDFSNAEYYFRLASNNNHPKSQYELALLCLNKNDFGEAKNLLLCSMKSNYLKAKIKFNELVEKKIISDFKKEIDESTLSKDDPDKVFEAANSFYDPIEALNFFDKFYDETNQLSKLRRAQILLKSDISEGLSKILHYAQSGFIEAKYVYGKLLEEGRVIKKNLLEAKKYYQEASKAGHPLAMTAYGRLIKVENQPAALKLFKEASDRNVPLAHYEYARILEISGAEEEAMHYYKMACDAGLTEAQFRYGRMFEVCQKSKQNYEIAAKYYKAAADKGYAKAQNNYGHILEFGLGVPKDPEMAATYYKMASEKGNSYAQHNYARVLEYGIGVPKNEKLAAQIYKRLAQNEENGIAQFNYARMCHNGIGVKEDFEEAKKYYLLAIEKNILEAKQNYGVLLFKTFHQLNEAAKYFEMVVISNGGKASAKYNYAQLLLQGMGVTQDEKRAEELLIEAASEEFLPAMLQYAQILERKSNDDNDELSLSAYYYKRASDMNDENKQYVKEQREAQYRISLMYRDGRGIERNEELYRKYLKMAADNKHPDAEELLNSKDSSSSKPFDFSLNNLLMQ